MRKICSFVLEDGSKLIILHKKMTEYEVMQKYANCLIEFHKKYKVNHDNKNDAKKNLINKKIELYYCCSTRITNSVLKNN